MDYAKLLATAKRLLQKNGKQITLSMLDDAAGATGKPWLAVTNPRDPDVVDSIQVYAINVPVSAGASMGIRTDSIELSKNIKSFYIAEPGTETPDNFDQYQLLTDGSQELKIAFIEKLKPADTALLYYIGVEA